MPFDRFIQFVLSLAIGHCQPRFSVGDQLFLGLAGKLWEPHTVAFLNSNHGSTTTKKSSCLEEGQRVLVFTEFIYMLILSYMFLFSYKIFL